MLGVSKQKNQLSKSEDTSVATYTNLSINRPGGHREPRGHDTIEMLFAYAIHHSQKCVDYRRIFTLAHSVFNKIHKKKKKKNTKKKRTAQHFLLYSNEMLQKPKQQSDEIN